MRLFIFTLGFLITFSKFHSLSGENWNSNSHLTVNGIVLNSLLWPISNSTKAQRPGGVANKAR